MIMCSTHLVRDQHSLIVIVTLKKVSFVFYLGWFLVSSCALLLSLYPPPSPSPSSLTPPYSPSTPSPSSLTPRYSPYTPPPSPSSARAPPSTPPSLCSPSTPPSSPRAPSPSTPPYLSSPVAPPPSTYGSFLSFCYPLLYYFPYSCTAGVNYEWLLEIRLFILCVGPP